MNTRGAVNRLTIGMALLALAAPLWADGPNKYALLVGVSKYNHAAFNQPAPLEFPEADARELGDVLQQSGYTVKLLLGRDATKKAVKAALQELKGIGSEEGVLFLGFFGHGVELADAKAYFCPFDAQIDFVKDASGETALGRDGQEITAPDPATLVSLPDDILRALKLSPAGSKVLVADACRDDPSQERSFRAKFAAKGRAFGTSLRIDELPLNTVVLLACQANQQAFENKTWGHGAFTKVLLEEFRTAPAEGLGTGALIDKLYRRVPALVREQTFQLHDQKPFALLHGEVDFQLVGTKAVTIRPSSSQPTSSQSSTATRSQPTTPNASNEGGVSKKSEERDFFKANTQWKGEIRQATDAFPTTIYVTEREGDRVRGEIHFQTANGLNKLVFDGNVFEGRTVAWTTDKKEGSVTYPGFYTGTLNGRQLSGVWKVPSAGQNDTFSVQLAE